jgi:proteasome assembly chaperone (PAC2) family protein
MHSDITLNGPLPRLTNTVLVSHLTGWIDASGAAAAAMTVIEAATEAATVATFDPDTFIDYRARRPTMELRDGVSTQLVWPQIQLKVGRDLRGTQVVLLTGPEPDSNWRRFAQAFAEVSQELGVQRFIGLGAYPFAAPHTRDARLSITTPSATLAATLSWLKSTLDVPAGLNSVLEHTFHDLDIEALGLWAQVPHYVSGMPYPAAAAALIEGLCTFTGLDIPTGELHREARLQQARIDQLVTGNDEHEAMVRQLEAAFDAAATATLPSADQLPSADELAAEVERFLRGQGD